MTLGIIKCLKAEERNEEVKGPEKRHKSLDSNVNILFREG